MELRFDSLSDGSSTQRAWAQLRDARRAWREAVDALHDFERRSLRRQLMTVEAIETGLRLRVLRNEAGVRLAELEPQHAAMRDGHSPQP